MECTNSGKWGIFAVSISFQGSIKILHRGCEFCSCFVRRTLCKTRDTENNGKCSLVLAPIEKLTTFSIFIQIFGVYSYENGVWMMSSKCWGCSDCRVCDGVARVEQRIMGSLVSCSVYWGYWDCAACRSCPWGHTACARIPGVGHWVLGCWDCSVCARKLKLRSMCWDHWGRAACAEVIWVLQCAKREGKQHEICDKSAAKSELNNLGLGTNLAHCKPRIP